MIVTFEEFDEDDEFEFNEDDDEVKRPCWLVAFAGK